MRVMARLMELIDAKACIYPSAHQLVLNWRQLQSHNHVDFTIQIPSATWLIADSDIECDQCASDILQFSRARGIADFALVGPTVGSLPGTMHITAVETHDDAVLTIGKRINL